MYLDSVLTVMLSNGARRSLGGVTTILALNKAVVIASQVVERSEEHTSELQSRETISYAVFCLKKKKNKILSKFFI